jgi:hypothetical protein
MSQGASLSLSPSRNEGGPPSPRRVEEKAVRTWYTVFDDWSR